MEDLSSRTKLLVRQATGLLGKLVFIQPVLHSQDYANSHRKGNGIEFLRSSLKRSLIAEAALIWDEEKKNTKGEAKYPSSSIPSIQYHLRDRELPEPEEYCFDGRALCLTDLREEKKEIYDAILTIRDKSLSHPELELISENEFRFFDFSECGLQNGNLKEFILRSIEIASALNHVVRSSDANFRQAAEVFQKHTTSFFGVSDYSLEYEPLGIKI